MTSKALNDWRVRLSNSSSTSSGRLKTGMTKEYFKGCSIVIEFSKTLTKLRRERSLTTKKATLHKRKDGVRLSAQLFLAHAAHIAAVACVDCDSLTLVDEQGHTDLSTSLESGRLCSVGSCVALHTRLTMLNLKVGLDRHLSRKDGTVRSVGLDVNDVTFLHELPASDHVLGDRNLLESLLVHEDVASGILVEILIRAMLYTHVIELEANLERTLQHAAVSHVLQLGVHDSVTLSWLTMLEVNALPNAAVHADACTDLNFL